MQPFTYLLLPFLLSSRNRVRQWERGDLPRGVLFGVGVARCAPCLFYVTLALTIVPFMVIPVAVGAAVTMLLVNVFPARRARDILMLIGLLFAASIVVLVRVVQPERLLRVESLP